MESILGASWIPKIFATLAALGTALLAMEQPYAYFGGILLGIAGMGQYFVRQNNVSSEAAGAKPPPQVIMHVDEPAPTRSHHK